MSLSFSTCTTRSGNPASISHWHKPIHATKKIFVNLKVTLLRTILPIYKCAYVFVLQELRWKLQLLTISNEDLDEWIPTRVQRWLHSAAEEEHGDVCVDEEHWSKSLLTLREYLSQLSPRRGWNEAAQRACWLWLYFLRLQREILTLMNSHVLSFLVTCSSVAIVACMCKKAQPHT